MSAEVIISDGLQANDICRVDNPVIRFTLSFLNEHTQWTKSWLDGHRAIQTLFPSLKDSN